MRALLNALTLTKSVVRSLSLITALASVACTLAPAGAAAGTAKLVRQSGDERGAAARAAKEQPPFELFEYSAAPGEVNRLVLATTRRGGDVLVTDPAGVALGRGCKRVVATDLTRARCRAPGRLGIHGLSAQLGDREDRSDDTRARIEDWSEAAIDGGTGDDVMTGGTLRGGAGSDTLRGDQLAGGPGSDILIAADDAEEDDLAGEIDESDPGNGSDVLRGGKGEHDYVRYTGRTAPVRVDLRAPSGAGEAGENDRITGIEGAEGGRGDDVLIGTDGSDSLDGGGGTDQISGGKGNDSLHAYLVSYGHGSSRDKDRIDGGPGDDHIEGSNGANVLEAGPGQDDVIGAGGNDRIISRDRSLDSVSCNSGRRDGVRADALDFVPRSCERLRRRGLARAIPLYINVESTDRLGPEVRVGCSIDGPALCHGTVRLYRGGLRGTRTFKVRRGRVGFVSFRTQELRRLQHKRVRIVVTARNLRGQSRSAARTLFVFTLGPLPEDL